MLQYTVKRINERRSALGWSYKRLAEECQLHGWDVTGQTFYHIEKGNRRLNPDELVPIARALGVDPNWLVGWRRV